MSGLSSSLHLRLYLRLYLYLLKIGKQCVINPSHSVACVFSLYAGFGKPIGPWSSVAGQQRELSDLLMTTGQGSACSSLAMRRRPWFQNAVAEATTPWSRVGALERFVGSSTSAAASDYHG